MGELTLVSISQRADPPSTGNQTRRKSVIHGVFDLYSLEHHPNMSGFGETDRGETTKKREMEEQEHFFEIASWMLPSGSQTW